jgi:hypothetical protein
MISQLIENLSQNIQLLADESFGILDFDKLKENLVEAINVLKNLEGKENFYQKVISDCKKEIKRMCRAIASLKNGKGKIGLVEKLVEEENLGYEDLIKLKEVVKKELDESFSVRGKIILVCSADVGFYISGNCRGLINQTLTKSVGVGFIRPEKR